MRGRGMDRGVVLGGTCPSTCERIGASLSRPIRPHRHRVRCHDRASPSSAEEKTNREERMGLRIWGGLLLLAAALAMNGGARAQSYPDRPVRMVIAFPAGGTIDTLGRILSQKLTEASGQNVVIENRPGGGGNIGAAAAAKSTPDGYTLHLGAQTLGVNVTLQPSKDFDPLKDFDPIMLVATAQDVLLVPPNSPFRSVPDLINYAK